jgi:hypothetical protein
MEKCNIEDLKEKIFNLKIENENIRKKIESNQDEIDKLYIEISKCEANDLIEYCKEHLIGKCCKFTKVEELFTFKWFMVIKDYEEEYDGDELTIKVHAETTILTIKNKTNELVAYTYDKECSYIITSSYEDGLSGYFNYKDLVACSLEEFNTAKDEIYNMLKENNG